MELSLLQKSQRKTAELTKLGQVLEKKGKPPQPTTPLTLSSLFPVEMYQKPCCFSLLLWLSLSLSYSSALLPLYFSPLCSLSFSFPPPSSHLPPPTSHLQWQPQGRRCVRKLAAFSRMTLMKPQQQQLCLPWQQRSETFLMTSSVSC